MLLVVFCLGIIGPLLSAPAHADDKDWSAVGDQMVAVIDQIPGQYQAQDQEGVEHSIRQAYYEIYQVSGLEAQIDHRLGDERADAFVAQLLSVRDLTRGAAPQAEVEAAVTATTQMLRDDIAELASTPELSDQWSRVGVRITDKLAEAEQAYRAGNNDEVVRRISQTETGIAHTLQTLIWIVSIIICLLTLISITATLNAVVSERAREIGLKKALGAVAKDVMSEFVGESILLGLIGGAVGVAAGIWIANFISTKAFAVQLDVNWWVVPITLVFSVIIALVGSLVPARRISRINPVDVLGGE